MTSVPDHGQGLSPSPGQQQQQQQQQQQPQPPQPDIRRLLAQHPASLRLAATPSTPPPTERYLPAAPPAVGQQPSSQCDPGDPYLRRELPGTPSSAYYRLPPHVSSSYQSAYECGGGGGGGGSGRTLPPLPGEYLPPPHYHHTPSSYHYQTLPHHHHHNHHPNGGGGGNSTHHHHHHRTSPAHHHTHHHQDFPRRHQHQPPQCHGYMRHNSRSARLEELLSASTSQLRSQQQQQSRITPLTPNTPRRLSTTLSNDVIENPMCGGTQTIDRRSNRTCYSAEPPRINYQPPSQQQQQQQQQIDQRSYQSESRPDSRCSLSSITTAPQQQQTNQQNIINSSQQQQQIIPAVNTNLPISWRSGTGSTNVATPTVCTTPPSGQATPASPSSSSSPSASATSSTSAPSCSSSCVSSSSNSVQAASAVPSPRAASPPITPVVLTSTNSTSPVESTTADTPRVARAMSRSETVKNYIKKGTAEFFGLCDGDDEEKLRLRWLERRKRLAVRKCGALREDCQPVAARHALARQRVLTQSSRPDVLPTDSPDHPSSQQSLNGDNINNEPTNNRWTEPPVRRKESVARMALGGLGYVINTLTRHRARQTSRSREWSRSYSPATALETSRTQQPSISRLAYHDELFFDKPASYVISEDISDSSVGTEDTTTTTINTSENLRTDTGFSDETDHRVIRPTFTSDRAPSWRRNRQDGGGETTSSEVGASRIWNHVLDRALDNSDRRQYGMGMVGRILRRSMRRSAVERHKKQLDDLEDYRPFFTYWVTTVHVLVMALSILCYGLGPLGLDLNQRSGLVMVPSLSLQQVDYLEPANFWIGPRAADLIHLGAKFAPCMRKDHRIWRRISTSREKERETACCIRNDDSGCVQSSQAECSGTISTWKKWSAGEAGPGGRISGSVCGLDPKYCEAPASIAPYEWPDDITKWPICRKPSGLVQQRRGAGNSVQTSQDKRAEHMVCEVIAHPCCIGIHGSCSITTREYCDFVRGRFHEEASLCSQVSCLDDVCGMIPFYAPDRPDQFYRLWTSLFLHAGLVHLLLTLVVQLCIMRDVERLTGPLRMAIIYLGSGMGGNLASAIFVPYRAEVGPSGAHFGLLACLVIEVLDVWPLLKRPEQALLKLLSVVALLLLLGLLPWVDNWAHVFGFVFGLLLSSALLPFVTLGSSPYTRHRKRVQIWACISGAILLFLALVAIFYLVPVINCPLCDLFNCLPLTPQFCAEQDINFGRDDIV